MTRGGRKKVLMINLMLAGNSLEIGCKIKIGFLGGEFWLLRKVYFSLTDYFRGKSEFPGCIWAVYGSYRDKMEPICHPFPIGPKDLEFREVALYRSEFRF